MNSRIRKNSNTNPSIDNRSFIVTNAVRVVACWFFSLLFACGATLVQAASLPSEKIDLRFWKLTLPVDADGNGKVDEVSVADLASYVHPDYFNVDDYGWVVFTSPNKAATTKNSGNTRSELRQMFRGTNTRIGTHAEKNNFALQSHPFARKHADIGGQLDATLRVLQVAENAKNPGKRSAYSVVVGQIHALKNQNLVDRESGFGWGNEPIKIFYKKWPNHSTGSVFWTYERNLAPDDPNRTDIAYPVWGNTWENSEDPAENGISLGQAFNYNINVYRDVMHLTFRTSDPAQTISYKINLADNIDAFGNVDSKDNPKAYAGDSFYFKAGAYNQCTVSESGSSRYPACNGSGDWVVDKANGDYTSVAFKRITLSRSVRVAKD